MKTASLPSVRIEPELRQKAEDFLREGETLSAFVEQAVRDTIRSREIHQQFLDRGITARDEARAAGDYYTADDVMAELEDMLAEARTQADS